MNRSRTHDDSDRVFVCRATSPHEGELIWFFDEARGELGSHALNPEPMRYWPGSVG